MIRVFPVAAAGAPHFTDDFGVTSQKSGRSHQGIDIFATEGTPIVAVDDGAMTFAQDPTGGRSFYLAASTDDVTYYGTHLSAYEGESPRNVQAGEVIGYVGHDGNASNTSPHLHFEAHPGRTRLAVDPYTELKALTPPTVLGLLTVSSILPVPAGITQVMPPFPNPPARVNSRGLDPVVNTVLVVAGIGLATGILANVIDARVLPAWARIPGLART